MQLGDASGRDLGAGGEGGKKKKEAGFLFFFFLSQPITRRSRSVNHARPRLAAHVGGVSESPCAAMQLLSAFVP